MNCYYCRKKIDTTQGFKEKRKGYFYHLSCVYRERAAFKRSAKSFNRAQRKVT